MGLSLPQSRRDTQHFLSRITGSHQSCRPGVPNPRPWTGTGLRPVRNRAAQQEVSGGRVREASSAAPPIAGITTWTIPPTTSPWKNCLPWNQSLVPKRLGTADVDLPNYEGYSERGQKECRWTGLHLLYFSVPEKLAISEHLGRSQGTNSFPHLPYLVEWSLGIHRSRQFLNEAYVSPCTWIIAGTFYCKIILETLFILLAAITLRLVSF